MFTLATSSFLAYYRLFPPPACPKSRNFELQSASCKALEGVEPADKALFGRAPPCKIMHRNLHAPYFSARTSAPTNIKPTCAIFWRKWAINDLKCFRPAKKHLKIYGINYQISILTVFFPKFQENVASPERVLWLRYRPAYRPEKSVSSTGR